MAAVGLDLQACHEAIDEVHRQHASTNSRKLTVACMNSKTSHTISGEIGQIEALVEMLKARGVFARKLTVEIAYHSAYMEPVAEEYVRRMGMIEVGTLPQEASTPVYFSSTYGRTVTLAELRDPSYWTTNLVSPVRFYEAVSLMLRHKPSD